MEQKLLYVINLKKTCISLNQLVELVDNNYVSYIIAYYCICVDEAIADDIINYYVRNLLNRFGCSTIDLCRYNLGVWFLYLSTNMNRWALEECIVRVLPKICLIFGFH